MGLRWVGACEARRWGPRSGGQPVIPAHKCLAGGGVRETPPRKPDPLVRLAQAVAFGAAAGLSLANALGVVSWRPMEPRGPPMAISCWGPPAGPCQPRARPWPCPSRGPVGGPIPALCSPQMDTCLWGWRWGPTKGKDVACCSEPMAEPSEGVPARGLMNGPPLPICNLPHGSECSHHF